MVKKKKRGRKQGIVSKVANAALIGLAFFRPLQLLLDPAVGGNIGFRVNTIIKEATFGLSEGSLDVGAGLRMYTPVGGAAALGFLKSFIMKKFPVR